MQRCQRLQILQLGPAPDQGPDQDLDLIPGLTREATRVQDPENVVIALGLAPALVHTLRPTETTLAGTIKTTEVDSGATTEATGDHTTIEAEGAVIINEVIIRTEEEEEEVATMATSPTGKVAAAVVVVVEAGTIAIATMTRITTHTVPEGAVHAPAHPRSALEVAAALATLTAHLQVGLGAPGVPATPLGPGLHLHVIEAAKASLAPRMLKTSK